MRSSLSFLLIASLVAPLAHAADAYDDLQTNIHAVQPFLESESADTKWMLDETARDTGEELFPDDGTQLTQRQAEDPGKGEFVTFRLGGVPYALNDVPVRQWFAPYVRDMADLGIVSGYRDALGIPTGIFGPERSVSIEELAKMAIVAAGMDISSCPAVPKNPMAAKSWSSQYVSCAEAHNLIIYADGTVDISRPATRSEVVMTVLQAFGVPIRDMDPSEKLFTDVSASTLFSSAIKTAVGDSVVSGYADASGKPTGFFGPDKTINRAEVCKVLSRARQIYLKK